MIPPIVFNATTGAAVTDILANTEYAMPNKIDGNQLYLKRLKGTATTAETVSLIASGVRALYGAYGQIGGYTLGTPVRSTSTITGATAADPVVISAEDHPFVDGERVYLTDVPGMVELNGRYFTVANAGEDDFELSGEDGTGHTEYSGDRQTVDLTGITIVEGYTYTVTVDGDDFEYEAQNGDDANDVADGLATEIDGDATYVATTTNAVITITSAAGLTVTASAVDGDDEAVDFEPVITPNYHTGLATGETLNTPGVTLSGGALVLNKPGATLDSAAYDVFVIYTKS